MEVLVTVTGPDRPGVTAALFAALPDSAAHEVVDVEQVVVRGRLLLGVHLRTPLGLPEVRALLAPVRALGVDAEVEPVAEPAATGDRAPGPRSEYVVTALGSPVGPAALAAVAEAVSSVGGNIERILQLASYPVTCYELRVCAPAPALLREALVVVPGVDIAVQPAGLARLAQRLVVMDVDSTLITGEVIDMLAEHAGCLPAVAAVTERAMAGELDFAASLRERVALLAGLPVTALEAVRAGITLTPGARTLVRTLQHLGNRVALVSGGFIEVVGPLATGLGISLVAANSLEVADGRLTGRVVPPVVDRAGKAAALRRFAAAERVPLAHTVAIGDGANDLDMLAAAGLGIAFNAKPAVRAAADAALNVPFLDAVLFLLGLSRSDVTAVPEAVLG